MNDDTVVIRIDRLAITVNRFAYPQSMSDYRLIQQNQSMASTRISITKSNFDDGILVFCLFFFCFLRLGIVLVLVFGCGFGFGFIFDFC